MKTHRHPSYLAFMIAALGALALGASASASANDEGSADTATYSVVFVPSWNPASHAVEYPITHAKHGLLTPIIGATHGGNYRIFTPGTTPTPGLETLSEMGKHSPLDSEIKAAIAARTASSLIEFADASPGPVHPVVSATFDINQRQPMVSLVGMVAPSPDWFYGVSAVELLEDGRWLPSVSVNAYAWDSGGDAGTTYMAEDLNLEPKAKTRLVDTPHFVTNGDENPVGVFIFTQIPSSGM